MSDRVRQVNAQEFETEVAKPGLTIVDFSAVWCGPCRAMVPVLEQVAAETDVRIIKVDVDQEQALAAKYDVRSIPNFLFIKEGRVVHQVIGSMPKAKMLEAITKANAA